MNKSIRRILKSIVQTHGTVFTQSSRLCNAYLADLMPNFPEERRHLVAALAYGLPHKVLAKPSRQQYKELALAFGLAHSIPAPDALAVADTWSYALQDTALNQQPATYFSWIEWPSYLGGAFTGIVVLLLGSAIAFYKKPDSFIAIETAPEKPHFNTTATRTAANQQAPLQTQLPTTKALTSKPLQPIQLTELPFLLPLAVKPSHLDSLDIESIQPVLLLKNAQALAQPPASLFIEPLTQISPRSVLNSAFYTPSKAPLNLRPRALNSIPANLVAAPQPTKQTKAPIPQAQLALEPSKAIPKGDQVKTKQFLQQALQDAQTLVEQILRLHKKQADQQTIAKLFKLTGDPFYQQQLAELDEQVQELNLSIDHWAASYGKQVAKLCGLSATGWQDEQLLSSRQRRNKLQASVVQDWKQCKSLSTQQIKQQLLTRYQTKP
ncbi:MAG: hypothetical protein WBP46_01870 [Thiolinea sp.]